MRSTAKLACLLFVAGLAPACTDPGPDATSGTQGGGKGDGSGCTGAPGEVDTCFGFQPLSDLEQVLFNGSTVQTDGKILVFGTAQDRSNTATPYAYVPFVRRLLADGTPDATFTAALPATQGSALFHPSTVVVRPDGRMIVAGSYGGDGVVQMSVQHLLPNGASDPAMRSGSFWPPSSLLGYTTTAGVNKILLEQDGSYYAAGTLECISAFTCDSRAMFVAHYDATGMLDTTYGKDGFALVKAGQHTRLVDAVRVGDATYVLGDEGEPTWSGGQELSFNRVIVGKVGATGALDSTYGTDGVFSWYDSGATYGSVPQAMQVQADGSIAIATLFPTNQILSLGSDGKTTTTHPYGQGGQYYPAGFAQFGHDGSLFAETTTYPIAKFQRFAADGTDDTTFTSAAIDVTGVPTGTVFLGATATEESDAWLVTGNLFEGADNKPESQLMMFRLWK